MQSKMQINSLFNTSLFYSSQVNKSLNTRICISTCISTRISKQAGLR